MADVDVSLLTRVASLYYREGLTQQQTAQRMGVSRQTIGRLLEQAQELGIVRIEINSPVAESESLARQIEAKFGLTEAIVTASEASNENEGREAIGRGAISLLARRIRPGMLIGLGWSSTVLAVVKQLSQVQVPELRVVQLDGGVPHGRHPNESADVVYQAAIALDARPAPLMTPLYVDTAEIRNVVVSDSQIRDTLMLAKRAELAIFGVGAVSRRSTLYATGYLADDLIDQLLSEGAVGEILGRFYDKDGLPKGSDLAARTIGIDLDALVQIPFKCIVASGTSKVAAIAGALRGQFANALVTDEATAIALLTDKPAT
jgi:deoxyribonucleoside regulator